MCQYQFVEAINLAYSVNRRACSLPLKDSIEVTVVSPRRRHPKKVVRATAQMAVWKGLDGLMALDNVRRCSTDTGTQRGHLWCDPSLFADIRAIFTHAL